MKVISFSRLSLGGDTLALQCFAVFKIPSAFTFFSLQFASQFLPPKPFSRCCIATVTHTYLYNIYIYLRFANLAFHNFQCGNTHTHCHIYFYTPTYLLSGTIVVTMHSPMCCAHKNAQKCVISEKSECQERWIRNCHNFLANAAGLSVALKAKMSSFQFKFMMFYNFLTRMYTYTFNIQKSFSFMLGEIINIFFTFLLTFRSKSEKIQNFRGINKTFIKIWLSIIP